jgi:hypothetical protein
MVKQVGISISIIIPVLNEASHLKKICNGYLPMLVT